MAKGKGRKIRIRGVAEILAALQSVRDEIDKEYWAFTRSARGVPPELYQKRTELENERQGVDNGR